MSNIKISQLNSISSPLLSTDLFEVSKTSGIGFISQKCTPQDITNFIQSHIIVQSSSYASTASYVLNGGGSSLTTGSTYPITSSYALTASSFSSISGSNLLYLQCSDNKTYPITLINESGSIFLSVGQTPITGTNNFLNVATVITSLQTGSTYPITSSFALTASYYSSSITNILSSSYANSSSYSNTSSYALNGGGLSLTTGSTYPITSSWANNALNSNNANIALDVANSSGILLTDNNTGAGIEAIGGTISLNATSAIQLWVNVGFPGLSITSSGIGIGTQTPHNALDVIGNISCSVITASLLKGTASFANTSSFLQLYDSGLGKYVTLTSYNGILTIS
jgi:hypothetical protein